MAPRGATERPGLDALLKGVARREFDIVAAWSVCRLGRSLPDLIGLLGELRSRDVDLYLHQQALDTSTPSGRMLFGMLGVFSEFERAMIRDRVMAGLDRARSSGKRLGRPRTTPFQVQRIRAALDEGRGVRETARLLKVSAAKVSEVRRMSATARSASVIAVALPHRERSACTHRATEPARNAMEVNPARCQCEPILDGDVSPAIIGVVIVKHAGRDRIGVRPGSYYRRSRR